MTERKAAYRVRRTTRRGPSALEALFAQQIAAYGMQEPEREHMFHPVRRWRFDFAWPDLRLAAEIEGGTWSQGRHTSGAGFERDCWKYNEAALLGWCVLRFTGGMVKSGEAAGYVANTIKLIEDGSL